MDLDDPRKLCNLGKGSYGQVVLVSLQASTLR
jgi:hypothetical protein